MELADKTMAELTIQQAKKLLECLETGKIEDAKEVLDGLTQIREASLFSEIGKLTRQLHEALSNFQLDTKITDIAANEIPDAKDRLNYVIEMTESAANKTMDQVEKSSMIAADIQTEAASLLDDWQRFCRREMDVTEFRELSTRVEHFLGQTKDASGELQTSLTDVLMAQDYQDLTGQVIRRVINMVHDVEESLVEMIRLFGALEGYETAKTEDNKPVEGVEGPVVDQSRDDVVKSQDDVDDLLSSLGF